MKKVLTTLLVSAILLSIGGCSQGSPVASGGADSSESSTVSSQTQESSDSANLNELVADIYHCNDVNVTNDTKTYGSAVITLPITQDKLEISEYQIILCDDDCKQADIVSRMSQGYAPAYMVVSDGELSGKHRVFRFRMTVPEPMVEEMKNQGTYEKIVERLESNYYYLLKIDEKHYAYLHLKRKAGEEKDNNEAALADSVLKDTEIVLKADTE